MKLSFRFNSERFLARSRAVMQELGPIQERAVIAMAAQFTEIVQVQAPRDTNRYVRGWLDAANKAGVGRYRMPALRKSHYFAMHKARLERQMERWSAVVDRERGIRDYWRNMFNNRYQRIGRDDKWARQAQRKMEAADKRLEKAMDIYLTAAHALADFDEHSILIGGRYGLKGNIGNDAARRLNDRANEQKLRKSSLDTVRNGPYGGKGHVLKGNGGGSTVVVLMNLEPHVRIVERRTRTKARALAAVRRTAIAKANTRMVRELGRAYKRLG